MRHCPWIADDLYDVAYILVAFAISLVFALLCVLFNVLIMIGRVLRFATLRSRAFVADGTFVKPEITAGDKHKFIK